MSYLTTVLADSPLGYYRFGEASGTTAVDASGNGNTGTISSSGVVYGVAGAPKYDANTAFRLTGSPGRVDLPFSSAGSAFTIELWVKPTSLPLSTSARLAADSHTDADNNGFQLLMNTNGNGGAIYFGKGTGSGNAFFSFAFSTTAWAHVVGTYDGTHMYVYVNGSQLGQAAFTGNISSSGFNISIGRNPAYNGDYFVGSVDECAAYRTALSQARIQAHYTAGTTFSGPFAAGNHRATARWRDGNL
jgi:hypothetical protein